MPELPEVETVRRGLEPHLVGARISEVVLSRPDLRLPFGSDFTTRLRGARVIAVKRRGKYLVFDLLKDAPFHMIGHLGMSGRFVIEDSATLARPGRFAHDHNRLTRHDHMVLHTDRGAQIIYNDPRRFGFLYLSDDVRADPALAAMGPEPLTNEFDDSVLLGRLKTRRTAIKTALLDQRTVAGLGNIYVCEALHGAGISPRRAAHTTTRAEAGRLVHAIRETLERAICAGGSTLRDHAGVDGTLGYFQHSFRVYDREGQPCLSEGCKGVVKRLVQAGRSTYFCPSCQSQTRRRA